MKHFLIMLLIIILAGCPCMSNRPEIVRNFQGENRFLPEMVLPLSVSPDALNIDYDKSSIKKRGGTLKLHEDRIPASDTPAAYVYPMMIPINSDSPAGFYLPEDEQFLVFGDDVAKKVFLDGASSTYEAGGGQGKVSDYCVFNGKIIVTLDRENEGYAVNKYEVEDSSIPNHALEVLTPPIPDASGTGAAGGVGGNPNGEYFYVFRYVHREIIAGSPRVLSESASSTDLVTFTATNQKIELSDIPLLGGFETQILRTQAGGTIYYHVDYTSSSSYSDNVDDVSLVTAEDIYVGASDPAKVCEAYNDMLFLMNMEDDPTRVMFSEKGSEYKFYPFNFIYVGRGDGEEIKAAMAISSKLVVFKERSIWIITGSGPQTVSAYKLYECEGPLNPRAITSSENFIYYVSSSGIMRMPVGLGAPPVNITANNIEPFTNTLYASYARAEYYPPTQEIYVSVFREADNDYDHQIWTYVYNEASGSIARLDIELWDILTTPDTWETTPTGELRLLGFINGFICELKNGNSDAVNILNETPVTYTGIVTGVDGGGDTYIDDSGASFPTDDDKLAGARVRITLADGTVKNPVIRESGSTATRLRFAVATTGIQIGDTYEVGAISAHWRSPRFSQFGQPGEEMQTKRIRTWFKPGGQDVDVTLEHAVSGRDGAMKDALSITLANENRFNNFLMNNKGRELTLEFSNDKPDEPFEIEAFQVLYIPTESEE